MKYTALFQSLRLENESEVLNASNYLNMNGKQNSEMVAYMKNSLSTM